VFSKALPFIMKYYIPSQLAEQAKARLAGYRKIQVDDTKIPEVYMNARRIYKQLALKLGNQDFFYGSRQVFNQSTYVERPSSLDAVAFAHLSLHAYPSMANPKLFAMLSFEFPTLISYCDRIKQAYFSVPPTPSPTDRNSIRNSVYDFISAPWTTVERWWTGSAKNPINKSREQRVEDFWRILSIAGGLGFFIGYVAYNGIVRVVHEEEEEEDYFEYQEEEE
jgi:metaxin